MTALNKQALREMAERAASDSWGYDRDEFNDAITPEVVLALLDELEAAEKSNVFLKGQLAELTNFNPDWDKLEASYESWCEIAAELLVAKDRIAELEALAGMEAEPVFKINHDSSLIKHVKKVVRETSAPQPLTNSERAELIPVYAATPEPVSVPDERAAFETFMEKRFKDCIDRRLVKNGDGEYFAWDMQVAWISWKGRAAMLQGKSAGNSPVVPDGWQLVPKEPTAAMNKAGWDAMNEHDAINPTYRAMLAAAPQQEVKSALEHGMRRYAGAMQKLSEGDD